MLLFLLGKYSYLAHMEYDLKEVIHHYFINPEIEDCSLLKTGLINRTYKIRINGHHYILQKINTTVFKSPEIIHSNIHLLNEYLKITNSSYQLLAPKCGLDGATLYHNSKGDCHRLFNFLENSKTILFVDNKDQAREAAAQFGTFTANFKSFKSENLNYPIKDFHNLSLRFDQFNTALIKGEAKRISKADRSIKALLHYSFIVQSYLDMVRSDRFKLRVMHHDAKISNVLFDEQDKGICLIDLDTVMPGYIFSDVGDMIRTYVCPVSEEETELEKVIVRKDFLEALEDGYLSQLGQQLTREERSSIVVSGTIIIYMQALRFMTDHLMNDVYYGAQYEDHNYHRSRNQIQLLNNLLSLSGKTTIFPLI